MASAAGSITDIESDVRLRNWFTAYINKLEDTNKQYLGFFEPLACRAKIPDEMSREYGDLGSVLREVEVDQVWTILMSVTGSQYFEDWLGRRRKRRDALYESISVGHGDITETIIEYLTPDRIIQFVQMQDDEGEKYLYSMGLHCSWRSSQLTKILYRLPEVSQRYEVLSIRDKSGRTVLHHGANKETLDSLKSQTLCFQLLSTQDNKGQTPLFTLSPSHLKSALDSVTVEQRLTLINMRDNEGQTAAEYHHTLISEEQIAHWRSAARANLSIIEHYRRESRIQIVMSTHDDDVRNVLMREIIEEESLTQEEIKKLSPLILQYVIPYNQAQEPLDDDTQELLRYFVDNEINIQRQAQTSRYGFIFYNTDQRENGAEEEAKNLQQALSETGCDVIKAKWGHTHQLQEMISDKLSGIGRRCNFLFACIMSHGELGQLKGSDDSLVSISTVIKLFEDNLPSHVPLVLMIQACQNSGVGTLGASSADMPAVYTASNSTDDKHVVLIRDHTVLLLASKAGGVAYRGAYTGELANQIRRANGYLPVYEMHSKAVIEMGRKYGTEQTPVYTDTLKKELLMPGSATT